MEFESLVSSPKAVSELNRLLGLHKVKPRVSKKPEQPAVENLNKVCKLNKKILKELKLVLDDSGLLSDYVATAARFTAISEKIINKLGGDLNVKEDIKTP